ncbi:hypothetical protein [Bradyrhizobium sp. Leo121]|uniref:hypothetical protein n=1 Tax=Bradyrhizobium sp. Leo121 TaxID=1571195 RepID=UPI0010291516|nr:hypothetical protein [Bradyrhizobium sp. Leo121]RZN30466.1 hypothetical protein CWO90_20225 [Bradyrhizobium sp. Leo121]
MIPIRIKGSTHYLGAPKGWDPDKDGPCLHLAVRASADGTRWESAWEPTPDELKALNEGSPVILRVVGGQPPVMLYVEPYKEESSR